MAGREPSVEITTKGGIDKTTPIPPNKSDSLATGIWTRILPGKTWALNQYIKALGTTQFTPRPGQTGPPTQKYTFATVFSAKGPQVPEGPTADLLALLTVTGRLFL